MNVPPCEIVVDWKLVHHKDGDVSMGDEIECGKPGVLRDEGTTFCFLCARHAYRDDVLSRRGAREFRQIEARILALPS